MTRKLAIIGLSLLATILLGTIAVLSTVKAFFGVDWSDLITEDEAAYFADTPSLPRNESAGLIWKDIDGVRYEYERIPRIIHQTWKTDTVPEKWASFSAQCREMHPDFTYMLWTDDSSHEFIAQHYSWFLPTFEAYPFNIQRADAIRYFVLHKYGGVYMDLDIGCRKPVTPLLHFPVTLPVTNPVGISNDLMFSEPGHPFMDAVIHNLMAFDHNYVFAYATVMFSTGPMFLSAMLALWNSKGVIDQIRLLPKSLYGKNVDPADAPLSFFWHYYGSSWHSGDSDFIFFIFRFGKTMMNIAALVIVVGTLRILWGYRYAMWSKVVGKPRGPRTGAIALPLHVQDGTTSRPPTPYHSRNPSLSASRPSSPTSASHVSRASISSLASEPALALPTTAGSHGGRNNSALGQRGSLYFLPLWYPTSPGAQPTSLDPPPAYQPAHIQQHQQQASSSAQPMPDLLESEEEESGDEESQRLQGGGGRRRRRSSSSRRRPTVPQRRDSGWTSHIASFLHLQRQEQDGIYSRANNVPANPASDTDALSLHSVKIGRQ